MSYKLDNTPSDSVGQQAAAIRRAVASLAGSKALLIGDFVLDTYVYGETVRVSREAPVIVVRKEKVEYRLGGAANTAANLTALGVQTRVLGALGADEGGAELEKQLRLYGVDTSGIQRIAGLTTPVKTRVLAGAFGTSRQQVLRIDDEPQRDVDPSIDASLAADLRREGPKADIIIVSDYGMKNLGPNVISAVQELAQSGRLVCVDSRYRLLDFKGVTAITPNAPEAEGVVGFTISDEASARKAGFALLQQMGCEACLLTQGRHGMTLFRQGVETPEHVDIVGNEEVTDVTGAGDTVIAAFSAALAAGLGMYNSMTLANCAAGIVVTKMGCAQVTPAELTEAALAAANQGVLELRPWDE